MSGSAASKENEKEEMANTQSKKHKETSIDFLKLRYIAGIISLIGLVATVFIWIDLGDAKYGVDFAGGTEVGIRFGSEVSSSEVRGALKEAGITGAIVQAFEEGDNSYSIRVKGAAEDEVGASIRSALNGVGEGEPTILKEDFVGPVIGAQIREDASIAIMLSLICILAYISMRFEWRFAMGAVAAVVHDVTITTGAFLLYGGELSAAVIAGLLTIVGYSLNDTIIIFDRIRENIQTDSKKSGANAVLSLTNMINRSINQTLSRTLLTSLTTLFVALCLWIFGGGAIRDLAFILTIGIVVGTYSTMYIASPVILLFVPKKQNAK